MTQTRLLMLEVTSHCNMHCTFYPSDDLVRKKGHVSDEQAIQPISRGARPGSGNSDHVQRVPGEPFLNKEMV